MNISITTYLSTITFFIGLLFILSVFFRKPTKTHIDEIKESGEELIKIVRNNTEDFLLELTKEKQELNELKREIEKMLIEVNRAKEEVIKKEKQIKKVNLEKNFKDETKHLINQTQARELLNEKEKREYSPKEEIKVKKMPVLGTEKKKAIISMYNQGYDIKEIAKKWGISTGVVELVVNVEKNKETV